MFYNAHLDFWMLNNCVIIFMPLLHIYSQNWMEHCAPLPCDACNYGTCTPFSQQGGASFSSPSQLNSQAPAQSAATAFRIANC